jgi:hypothetical protein
MIMKADINSLIIGVSYDFHLEKRPHGQFLQSLKLVVECRT